MLNDLWALTLDTYRAPRAGARRAIDAFDSGERIALIFALSVILVVATVVVVSIVTGADFTGGAGAMSFLASSLVAQAIGFVVSVVVVYAIGRWFGGKGGPREIAAAIAWHAFVSAVPGGAAQGLLLARPGSAGASLALLIIVAVAFWLFINFVAEAHRFASAMRVAGVVVAVAFAVSLVIAISGVLAISAA